MLAGLMAWAMVTAWAQDKETVKHDQELLQGTWSMVSGARDGAAFPADYLKHSKRVAKDDEVTVMLQGQLFMKAKFKLDPTKTPKQVDYAVSDGPYAGTTQLGIYELEGEQVKFCFSVPGKVRPTDFTTKPSDGRTLSVWKKEKK